MKFLFIVQGEGRGHLTQAISLFRILEKNGHKVCHVIVGKSKRRELPKFFQEQVTAPIHQLESPNFATDKKGKSVRILKTIYVNLFKVGTFLRSVREISRIEEQEEPDVIINFYDFIAGVYFFLKKPKAVHIAVAHQFLLDHSSFTYPKGRFFDRTSLRLGNKLASYKALKKLCLSFQELPNEPKKRIHVVPPLLRKEIREKSIGTEDHFLVYMVNHGYSVQVEDFHSKYPEIPIHCFWDKKGVPDPYKPDNNLTFHQLNDKKFIEYMSTCKGYLTTAGFESVCEAMYMGKPTLMVPVKGHYEQSCNAVDAVNAGAGVSSEFFDLEILLSYLPSYESVRETFHHWCEKTEHLFIKNLTDHVN